MVILAVSNAILTIPDFNITDCANAGYNTQR